jgi:hypothetical protein
MKRININADEFLNMVEEKCLFVIGGYENMMTDSTKGDENYEYAKETINNPDAILDEAFDELENDLRASISERLRKAVTPNIKARLNEMGY